MISARLVRLINDGFDTASPSSDTGLSELEIYRLASGDSKAPQHALTIRQRAGIIYLSSRRL
jgi:hypothetical protein